MPSPCRQSGSRSSSAFAARAGEVSKTPGFETFELMRPTDGRDVYLVYTRWRSEDDFQAWVNSPAFQHGHKAHSSGGPVGTGSELWSFDVIQDEAGEDPTVRQQSPPVGPRTRRAHGAGGAFEIVTDDVLGVPIQVYKNRLHSLGELIGRQRARAPTISSCRAIVADLRGAQRGGAVLAARSSELGVGHGDRVAIVSANSPSGWCCGGGAASAPWSCH